MKLPCFFWTNSLIATSRNIIHVRMSKLRELLNFKVYKLYFIASCLKYVLCLCLNLLICDVVLCFAFSSIFMFGECGFNLLLISYILLAWFIIFCSIIYVVKFAWYLLYLDLLSGIFLVVTIVHRENFV